MSAYSHLWSAAIEAALFYQGAWNLTTPEWKQIPIDAYILSRTWRQPIVELLA